MVGDAGGQAAADGGLHQEDVHRSDQGRTDMTFRVFHELEKLVQRRASGLRLGWVDFDLGYSPTCSAASANFPLAQAEIGRGWNRKNQCQPKPVANLTLPSVLYIPLS